MELNNTSECLSYALDKQISLYKTACSASKKSGMLVRGSSPLITGSSLLISLVGKIATLCETLFKGISNILLGIKSLDLKQFGKGCKQIFINLPLQIATSLVVEALELTIGTMAIIIDPKGAASTIKLVHTFQMGMIEEASKEQEPKNPLDRLYRIMYY